MTKNKVALIVLDGWGHGARDNSDAVYTANTPFMDSLEKGHPSAELLTDGENVGLPEGQMGNSEVGHMNIGAGRVVYQDLVKINREISSGDFFNNDVLLEAMNKAKESGRLHLMGLVSNGGVHSSQEHLHALCTMAAQNGIENTFIHVFTDGRDTDPKSAQHFVAQLEEHIKDLPVQIATVVGRYYAMDRDRRWERVKMAYDLLVSEEGAAFDSALDGINASYADGVTDEFIKPISVTSDTDGRIQEGDTVVCFNFRTDRCREITMALTQEEFPDHEMTTLSLNYYTMTRYDQTFKEVGVIYEKNNLNNTLGEVVSAAGATQVRIAETEKYPHVTFFFSGGREEPFSGEDRIMVHSPKVPTYDLQPEMSAPEVADAICKKMDEEPDLIVLNFANPDMVGHTGVFDAIVKAVEATDQCLNQVMTKGLEKGYSFIVIADHGNADNAVNPDGSPNTAHSLNPVPVVVISDQVNELKNGILADVSPTILKIMGIEKPAEMTGSSLF